MRTRYVISIVLSLACLLALTGCDLGQRSQGPLPTVVLGDPNAPVGAGPQAPKPQPARSLPGSATASAVIAPAREAQLVMGYAGRISMVHVAEGEWVQEAQILLNLDDQAIQAELGQAQAALDAAQVNHDLLAAGASAEDLRQAQAVLDGAQAAMAALEAGPRAESIAQAEANLVTAQAALTLLGKGPTALAIEGARLSVEQANNSLWGAQSNRDYICGSGSLKESQCDGAQAQVLVAESTVRLAENQMAQLFQSADQETIDQAQQAVRVAEAQLALAQQPITEHDLAAAQAQVDGAQAALDALKSGAGPEQLAAAQAAIAAAQAGVQAVEARLALLELKAPFAGALTDLSVYAGQWVNVGQVVASLADLNALVVETTDLSELDVPRIGVGQTALVTIEALVKTVPGRVVKIAPLPETLGGDVVYRITIALDEQPAGLRAGMSAEVVF